MDLVGSLQSVLNEEFSCSSISGAFHKKTLLFHRSSSKKFCNHLLISAEEQGLVTGQALFS